MKIGIKGHFRIEKIDKKGNVSNIYEFDNLVTDYGLENIVKKECVDVIKYCQVGTGNSMPSYSQTALDNRIASKADGRQINRIYPLSYPFVADGFYDFAPGAATGNIAEIGVGDVGTGGLFNRQLIKNTQGTPTVITVLPQEGLKIYFKLHFLLPSGWTKSDTNLTYNNNNYEIYYRVPTSTNRQAWSYGPRLPDFYHTILWGTYVGQGEREVIETYGSGEGTAREFSATTPSTTSTDHFQWYPVPTISKDKFHTMRVAKRIKFIRHEG